MELYGQTENTIQVNEAHVSKETGRIPTSEQVKKLCQNILGRVVEPFSTESVKEMPDDQRRLVGLSMAEAAINSTRFD